MPPSSIVRVLSTNLAGQQDPPHFVDQVYSSLPPAITDALTSRSLYSTIRKNYVDVSIDPVSHSLAPFTLLYARLFQCLYFNFCVLHLSIFQFLAASLVLTVFCFAVFIVLILCFCSLSSEHVCINVRNNKYTYYIGKSFSESNSLWACKNHAHINGGHVLKQWKMSS